MHRLAVVTLALSLSLFGCSRPAPEPEPVRAVRTLTVGATAEGSSGVETWEADVSRLEYGVGLTIRRGLLLKASVLGNWRDGGRVRHSHLGAVQALFWF